MRRTAQTRGRFDPKPKLLTNIDDRALTSRSDLGRRSTTLDLKNTLLLVRLGINT
jgi:hypothetical protein